LFAKAKEQHLPQQIVDVQICNAFQVDLGTRRKATEANPFLKTMSIHDAIVQLEIQRQDRKPCAKRVAKRISSWTMVSLASRFWELPPKSGSFRCSVLGAFALQYLLIYYETLFFTPASSFLAMFYD
jgi:hypothetical protein